MVSGEAAAQYGYKEHPPLTYGHAGSGYSPIVGSGYDVGGGGYGATGNGYYAAGSGYSAAGSGKGYGSSPCHGGVEYVTTYLTQVQEIPIYETIVKQEFVTTTFFQPIYKTISSVKLETYYETERIINTRYKTKINFSTEKSIIYRTIYLPLYITKTEFYTHSILTTTQATITSTQIEDHTETKIIPQPSPIVKTHFHHRTRFLTTDIYEHYRDFKTVYHTQTVCPRETLV